MNRYDDPRVVCQLSHHRYDNLYLSKGQIAMKLFTQKL